MAVFYNREKGKHGSLTGTIINFPKRITSDDPASTVNKELIPPGYLSCDGRILSATDYPMLAMVLGTGDECKFKKEDQALIQAMGEGSITVQPGNSLWRIARKYYGKGIQYVEIFERNSHLIKDPDLIYPGQVFSLPN